MPQRHTLLLALVRDEILRVALVFVKHDKLPEQQLDPTVLVCPYDGVVDLGVGRAGALVAACPCARWAGEIVTRLWSHEGVPHYYPGQEHVVLTSVAIASVCK